MIYKVGWLMRTEQIGRHGCGHDHALCLGIVRQIMSRRGSRYTADSGFMTELEFERELRDSVGSTAIFGNV